jgi:hypothetical protein
MDHLDFSFDEILPRGLQGLKFISLKVDLAEFTKLVPQISNNWDLGEFTIKLVKKNPDLGRDLLPLFRELPDSSWAKAQILTVCGEEEDLRWAVGRIISDSDHAAAYAAIAMLSRGIAPNLRENFEEALLAALGEESLSLEVEGVNSEFLPEARERVAWERWDWVVDAWEAKVFSATGLVRLASFPHLPVRIRGKALSRFLDREENGADVASIASILNKMKAPSDEWLCQRFLALIEVLPPGSIPTEVINGLEWESATLQKRILHSLLGHPLRP